MSGNLLNRARRDSRKFLTKGGFQSDFILESIDGLYKVELSGFHTLHFLGFDEDGRLTNSKNAHISFSEAEAKEKGYFIRNSRNQVDLKGQKISVEIPEVKLTQYVIKEAYPDNTLGLVVCILGDYESDEERHGLQQPLQYPL